MRPVSRRVFLSFLLSGGTAALAGVAVSMTTAAAAPAYVDKFIGSLAATPAEEAAVRTTCWWSRGRRICRRRRLRFTCWWRGGRRICGWR